MSVPLAGHLYPTKQTFMGGATILQLLQSFSWDPFDPDRRRERKSKKVKGQRIYSDKMYRVRIFYLLTVGIEAKLLGMYARIFL